MEHLTCAICFHKASAQIQLRLIPIVNQCVKRKPKHFPSALEICECFTDFECFAHINGDVVFTELSYYNSCAFFLVECLLPWPFLNYWMKFRINGSSSINLNRQTSNTIIQGKFTCILLNKSIYSFNVRIKNKFKQIEILLKRIILI